jgi:RHS repeat-associated protein
MLPILRSTAVMLLLMSLAPPLHSAPTPPALSNPDVSPQLPLGERYFGALAGQASVSAAGNASYQFALDLPPGINGLKPSISVNYNSNVQNGILGLGWFFGGDAFSRITRCPNTLAQNGRVLAVENTTEDRFCLDGQQLIAVNGNYGAAGTEYRTEADSFMRVESRGNRGGGPSWWLVKTRDGQTRYYGDQQSFLKASNSSAVRVWAARRVEDGAGNFYRLDYLQEPVEGRLTLQRIEFTGNNLTQTAPAHTLEFDYESRTDTVVKLQGGSIIRPHDQRVSSVRLMHNGQQLREYRFTYEEAGIDSRSRLRSISHCAANGSCQDDIELAWWDNGTPKFTYSNLTVPAKNTTNSTYGTNARTYAMDHGTAPRWHDMNGDGRKDYVHVVPSANGSYSNIDLEFQVRLSTPTGYTTKTWHSTLRGFPWQFVWADFNGDGLTDILLPKQVGGVTTLYVAQSTGSGFTMRQWALPHKGATYSFRDMNGDTLPDLVSKLYGGMGPNYSLTYDYYVNLNNGNGFGGSSRWLQQAATPVQMLDMNGDGLTDILQGDRYVYFSHGNGFSAPRDMGSTGYQSISSYADYNGDGLLDRFTRHPYGYGDLLYLNTGTTFYATNSNTRFPQWHLDDNGMVDGFSRDEGTPGTDVNFYYAKGPYGAGHHRSTFHYSGSLDYFFQVADLNGDGFGDMALADRWKCHTSGSYAYFCEDDLHRMVYRNNKPLSLLKSVTTGRGVENIFVYKPLSDSSVYTRGNSAVFPEKDTQDSTYVVSRLRQSNGIGGHLQTDYRYDGLKSDMRGRGRLGFARITAENIQANRVTYTDYEQRFPLVAQPKRVEVKRRSDGQLLQTVDTQYTVRGTPPNAVVQAFVSQRTEQAFDPDSATLLSTSVTANQMDNWGNITRTEITTTDHTISSTLQSVIDYTYDAWLGFAWRPAQLVVKRVTNRLDGSSSLPGGSVTTYAYHASTGLLSRQVRQPGGGAGIELTTTYDRDLSGNVTRQSLAGPGLVPRSNTVTYDSRQQFPQATTNAEGHTTKLEWDTAIGHKLGSTDANGLITRWQYDEFGQPTTQITPEGNRLSTQYYIDNANSVSHSAYYRETLSSVGAPGREFFDKLGRSLRVRNQSFSGAAVLRDTAYNRLGQAHLQSLAYFEGQGAPWNQSSFDDAGRLVSYVAADASQSKTLSYSGFDITVVDAGNQSTVRQVNAFGQVVSTIDENGVGTAMIYDSEGNRVQVTAAVFTAGESRVIYRYDILGRLISQDDADHGLYQYTYNALGQKLSQSSPELTAVNQSILYEYDLLGRMTKRIEPEGEAVWAYDNTSNGDLGLGKLHEERTGTGFQRNYSYDAGSVGQLTSVVTRIDGMVYEHHKTYNSSGQLTRDTYPAGNKSPSGFKVDYVYNPGGHLERAKAPGNNGRVYYQLLSTDAAGRTLEEWQGDGSYSNYSFDGYSGRLTEQHTANDLGTVQHFSYSYDNRGNMVSRADELHGQSEQFSYDSLSRLVDAAVNGDQGVAYQFDSSGNITHKSDYAQTYLYDGNAPHAVSATDNGAGASTISYNLNGNLTGGQALPSITWSSFNKPVTITTQDVDYTFQYDSNHKRYRKERNGLATHYVGNYERHWKATSEEHRYLIKVNGRPIFIHRETETQGNIWYTHGDHQGNLTALTKHWNGGILERYAYNPWGKRRHPTDWTKAANDPKWTNRGYTLHEHLDDVDLIHMNGRVYSPEIGRMISPDPVTQAPENGQNYNRYTYAFNNPLRFSDPSGYQAELSDGGGGFVEIGSRNKNNPRPLFPWMVLFFRSQGHPDPVGRTRAELCAFHHCESFGYSNDTIDFYSDIFVSLGYDIPRIEAADYVLNNGTIRIDQLPVGADGQFGSVELAIRHYADNVGDVATYTATVATIASFAIPGANAARGVATTASVVGVIADIAKGDLYSAGEGFAAEAGSQIFEMMVDRVPGFKLLPGKAKFRVVAGIMSVYELSATARRAAGND